MMAMIVKIYEIENRIWADIDYANGSRETIQWNVTEERKRILENTDGYTNFVDTRIL